MDNSSDNAILLLSTDWFSRASLGYDPWKRVGQSERNAVIVAARVAAKSILPATGSYFNADFSDGRIQSSKAIFEKEVKRTLSADAAVALEGLLSYIKADGDLAPDEYWTIRALFIDQVSRSFSDDPDGMVPINVRRIASEVLKISEDFNHAGESAWDAQLSKRFDDLPNPLQDYADSAFLPRCFFHGLAMSIAPFESSDSDQENFARWIATSIGIKFGLHLYSEDLLRALISEGKAYPHK